jgi:hypothetical protein
MENPLRESDIVDALGLEPIYRGGVLSLRRTSADKGSTPPRLRSVEDSAA